MATNFPFISPDTTYALYTVPNAPLDNLFKILYFYILYFFEYFKLLLQTNNY